MIHAPDSVTEQVRNVYDNFMSAGYAPGRYHGALLHKESDGAMQLNGFEPRWNAEDAWGIDTFSDDGEVNVGFFGKEQAFLTWYGEMCESGLLAKDPGDSEQVKAAKARAGDAAALKGVFEKA